VLQVIRFFRRSSPAMTSKGVAVDPWNGDATLAGYTNGASAAVGYGYDLASRLTGLTYPGSHAVTRGYNDANRLTSVTDWLAGSSPSSFGYDHDGNLTSITYAGSPVQGGWQYNGADQLVGLAYTNTTTSAVLLAQTYTPDPVGVLSATVETGLGTDGYSYDGRYRLTADTRGTKTNWGWGYDGATEVITTSYRVSPSTAVTTTRSFNAGDELLSLQQWQNNVQQANWSYTYDTRGNRTAQSDSVSSSSTAYGYDQAARLTSMGSFYSYSYNGDGLRARKTQTYPTTQITDYTWDVAAGLPLLLQDSTASYLYGPGGMLLEQIAGTTPYYYLADRQGSVRKIADGTGTVKNSYAYDAHGNPTSSSETITNPFRYTGQYLDGETGLYYLRARYYDPRTYQFLTVDPLLAVTGQAYNYAAGSPTNASDPSRLWVVGFGFLLPLRRGSIMEGLIGIIGRPLTRPHPLHVKKGSDTIEYMSTETRPGVLKHLLRTNTRQSWESFLVNTLVLVCEITYSYSKILIILLSFLLITGCLDQPTPTSTSIPQETNTSLSQIPRTPSESNVGSPEDHYNRGIEEGKKGNYDNAIYEFNQALQLRPDYADAFFGRGVAYAHKGNQDQAIIDYNRALQLKPDYPEIYEDRGMEYDRLGNYDQAIADFDHALQLKPDYAEAYSSRGLSYGKKGNYDQAIQDVNQAIKLKPDFERAYGVRADVYEHIGDYDRALADYNAAIHLNPQYADAYFGRGITFSLKGDYANAIQDFNQTIILNPDRAVAYLQRGLAYRAKGDYDLAIADFTQAIQLQSNYAEAYLNRGKEYIREGEIAKARADLQKVLELSNDFSLRKQALDALNNLPPP